MNSVVVDVKSGWLSKVNWTQAIGVVASVAVVLTGGKVNIDLATQGEIVVGIQSIVAVATWALRTFGKPTATPAQAAKLT